MSEEAKVDQEQKVLGELRQEYLNLCAQAGEKQYIVSVNRKELTRINIKLRKINKKADGIMAAKRLQEEAKKSAVLKVVPEPAV